MKQRLLWTGLMLCLCQLTHSATQDSGKTSATDIARFSAWVSEMKGQAKGPFQRIRWFCSDGTVLPPRPYACREHGGGKQHGEWSERTKQIRESGFYVANVLAGVTPEQVSNSRDELLQQILLEQFLVGYDDGWILRGARFYRGAFQAENEEAAAADILQHLSVLPEWAQYRYLLLYEAARLLPHGFAGSLLGKVRADAVAIQNADAGFAPLRNKIHGKPDPSDAQAVRHYARTQGKPELQQRYEQLALDIEQASDPSQAVKRLKSAMSLAQSLSLRQQVQTLLDQLSVESPQSRLTVAAQGLYQLRQLFGDLVEPRDRVLLLDVSQTLEQSVFASAQGLLSDPEPVQRQELLSRLSDLVTAYYGVGGLSDPEFAQFNRTLVTLSGDAVSLKRYQSALRDLANVATWAQRRLALHFELAVGRLSGLEPLSQEYIPDRLRSSPMLMFSRILDQLTLDANSLSGVQHEFLGRQVSTGLRSLNPGSANGILMTQADYDRDPLPGIPKILVVPETLADLPPVAGILTANEGNYLSHVQILARNLSIPNVVVQQSLLNELDRFRGKPVQMDSSPGGVVHLNLLSEGVFADTSDTPSNDLKIIVDVNKLALDSDEFLSVSKLRSEDSGVRVGPKAAKLGELLYRYPESVSPGLALPFGSFRQMLDQPFDQGHSGFQWLKSRYLTLSDIADPKEQLRFRNETLSQIREWFLTAPLPEGFEQTLERRMTEEFGGTDVGVFVRSDTNVEDLPGFTGAGLNLTVPNVVGLDSVIAAIRQVWASPFTERAFGWRQALMDKPEHLYTAVLLHQGVNSDYSGVLVTKNVANGNIGEITVVVNEGVGGGVEGQSAETLFVSRNDKTVTLTASATAPEKRVLLRTGGSELVAASGIPRVLTDKNIDTLLNLTSDVESWLKDPVTGDGEIADIEFGFLADRLVLFQIRPFVDGSTQASNPVLVQLDRSLVKNAEKPVFLDQRVALP